MSASGLPAYRPATLARSPASPVYTPEPQAYEQRLALNRIRERPSTEFVKQSKTGGLSLRLSEQEDNASLPVYGCGDSVEGTVDLTKPESASSVEVRVSSVSTMRHAMLPTLTALGRGQPASEGNRGRWHHLAQAMSVRRHALEP